MKICKMKKSPTWDERGERKKIKEIGEEKEWREGDNYLHLGHLEEMQRWKGGWDVAFHIMIACHHGTLMTIKILLQSILCDSLSYGYSLGSTIWELQWSSILPMIAVVSTIHHGHPGSKWANIVFTSGEKSTDLDLTIQIFLYYFYSCDIKFTSRFCVFQSRRNSRVISFIKS